MSRPRVFLGLGSNLGDREHALERALTLLGQRGFVLKRRSSLYLTEPVGGPPQDWYLNMVVEGESALSPEDLLSACLDTERDLGRTREVRWGPRVVDIDLLLYGDERRATAMLALPHPRLHQRQFVLVPLVEIAPEMRHPVLQLTARELGQSCADTSRVERYDPQPGERR
jgi:2-amino-4-hydroxy-6-hydroxymethyldihydropteridine diphosphokinase